MSQKLVLGLGFILIIYQDVASIIQFSNMAPSCCVCEPYGSWRRNYKSPVNIAMKSSLQSAVLSWVGGRDGKIKNMPLGLSPNREHFVM